MNITRRQMLGAIGAMGLHCVLPSYAIPQTQRIIGASKTKTGQFALSCVDLTGSLQWQTPLPIRGHDVSLHPVRSLGVVCARRPQNHVYVFDTTTGRLLQQIQLPNGISNGHALWLQDRLILSASQLISGQVMLRTYQLKDTQLTLEHQLAFDFIEPHEIIETPKAIAIAIGGLKTDHRTVLNADNFQSGVLLINKKTLALDTFLPSPNASVSLRHLAVDNQGMLVIAGQEQRTPKTSPCLLYRQDQTQLTPIMDNHRLWSQIHGYIGSIATFQGHTLISSPRAHWLGIIDPYDHTLVSQRFSHDICALASSSQGIVAGSGTGILWVGDRKIQTEVGWDNHFCLARL